MNQAVTRGTPDWKVYGMIGLILVAVPVIVAAWTKQWFLTAMSTGLLFGFFLQKGDLCGSSAFSEVVMFKDYRKVFGLWVLIVVAMSGFAVLSLLGWVKLSPKPFLHLNYIVGGIIFGAGTVLAGGCISGCLYKSAAGNLNSIVALLSIPAGVMIVEYGFLSGLNEKMKEAKFSMADGSAMSLDRLLNLPFWVVASIILLATILTVLLIRGRTGRSSKPKSEPWNWERVMTKQWKPWIAGLAIGLLMAPGYLSSVASGRNYPLGVTHGVMQAELILVESNLEHLVGANPVQTAPEENPASPSQASSANSGKKIVWWLIVFSFGTFIGSWISARMSGRVQLLPKPPDEILMAILGGVLVGIGAAFAAGCVVGNIMSGWALLSVGMFLFGIVTILANWVTTYFYLMGGRFARK